MKPYEVPLKDRPLYYSRSFGKHPYMENIYTPNVLKHQPLILMPDCSHSIHLLCASEFSDYVHTLNCPDCKSEVLLKRKLSAILDPYFSKKKLKSLGLIRSEMMKLKKQSKEFSDMEEPEEVQTETDKQFEKWNEFNNDKIEETYQGMEVVMGLDWMGVRDEEYNHWLNEQKMEEYALINLSEMKEKAKKVKKSWRERRRERRAKRKAEKEAKRR